MDEVVKDIGKEVVAITQQNELQGTATAKFTWAYVMSFSFAAIQCLILSTAPTLWTVLTSALARLSMS